MIKHTKQFLALMLVLGSSALVMSAREKRRTNNMHTRNMEKGRVWKKVQGKMHAAHPQSNRHPLMRTGPRSLDRYAKNRNTRGSQIHTNLGRMQNRMRDQSQLEDRDLGFWDFDWLCIFTFSCDEEEEEGEEEETLTCVEECEEHDFKVHGVRMKCLKCCEDTAQIEETDKVVTKADIVEDEEGKNAARNLQKKEEVDTEPAEDEIYDCVKVAEDSLIKEQIAKLKTPNKKYKDMFENVLNTEENIKKIEEAIIMPSQEELELEEEGGDGDGDEVEDADDSVTQEQI